MKILSDILHIFFTGSPYRVDVMDASKVRAEGAGLELVPVDKTAVFDVFTGSLSDTGRVTAVVTGKSYAHTSTRAPYR